MSFFRRNKPETDEQRKARRMAEERAFERKKREKFLEEQTKDKNAGQQSEIKEAEAVIDEEKTFTGGPKKKGLKERIEEFKQRGKEKEYKEFLKSKEKAARKLEKERESEKKVFGKELSESEKKEFMAFKEKKQAVFRERRAKVKKYITTARKYSAQIGARGPSFNIGGGLNEFGKSTNEFQEFGKGNKDELGVLGGSPAKRDELGALLRGKDILSLDTIQAKKNNFELNFGRNLGGKKSKKGKRQKGLGLNIFD